MTSWPANDREWARQHVGVHGTDNATRTCIRFSAEEDAVITSMRETECSSTMIASCLGRNRDSIRYRIKFLKLPNIVRAKKLKEAKSKGSIRYFTGKPCPRGHVAERLVSNRACCDCRAEDEKNRDPIKQRARALRGQWRRNGMPIPTRPKPDFCELCGGPPTARALHLDHDKKNGAFRGWLCHYCNTNLGRFGDDIEGLERAVAYLKRAESNNVTE